MTTSLAFRQPPTDTVTEGKWARSMGLAPLPWLLTMLVLLALLALGGVLSLLLGSESISLNRALLQPGTMDAQILFRLRLPRLAAAASIGATLAVCGASLQALLRNPLADPYILGVSGGAAVGGSVVMALGGLGGAAITLPLLGTLNNAPMTMGAAFAGAMGATYLTFRIATMGGRRVLVYHALLAGVVINSLASAVVTFIKAVTEAHKTQQILLWLMGTLAVETVPMGLLVGCTGMATMTTLLLMSRARTMNLLALGEAEAQRLGLNASRSSRLVLLLTSLGVASCVAISGMIGFVGLVVPHALRLILGGDHRTLLPACALAGAALLTFCDLGSRLLFPVFHTEIPVGVLTALLGGPAFLWLLHKEKRNSTGEGK